MPKYIVEKYNFPAKKFIDNRYCILYNKIEKAVVFQITLNGRKDYTMKRILFLVLSILCITILCGCEMPDIPFLSGDNADDSSDNNHNNTTPPPEYYTVTFDSNGGTDVDPINVKPGETFRSPYAPIMSGATFVGWYYKGKAWDFRNGKIESDMTLIARWEYDKYTIEYDLSGGRYDGLLTTEYTIETDTIILGEPVRDGCRFAGWYLDGKLVTEIPKGTKGDLKLVADFYGPDVTVQGSKTAYARTWDNTNNITVRLTDTDNAPLTVTIDFNKQWDTVKVDQGGKIKYVKTYKDGDKLMLDIEMTPNGDDAVITPIILMGDTTLVTKYGTVLSNGTKVDKNYYPGFVRKSVTFTIDDGNIAKDTEFLNIIRPAGIKGTFNLINTNAATAAQYLALYKGYEIASHHQLHCLPVRDGLDFSNLDFKDEIFNSSKADTDYVYKTSTEGLYYIDYSYYAAGTPSNDPNHKSYWHPVSTNETYTKYLDITKAELEKVFGEGSIVGFAYPHGKYNQAVKEYLKNNGYLYARATTASSPRPTDFALPEDRYCWVYNADASNLNDAMAKYDALGDDGKLKFFSFGVHAVDFDGKWYILQNFASKYGNRPDEFWYASNREIFEYEDAVKALVITEEAIVNPSSIDVFVTINDIKTIIPANSTYPLS